MTSDNPIIYPGPAGVIPKDNLVVRETVFPASAMPWTILGWAYHHQHSISENDAVIVNRWHRMTGLAQSKLTLLGALAAPILLLNRGRRFPSLPSVGLAVGLALGVRFLGTNFILAQTLSDLSNSPLGAEASARFNQNIAFSNNPIWNHSVKLPYTPGTAMPEPLDEESLNTNHVNFELSVLRQLGAPGGSQKGTFANVYDFFLGENKSN